MSNQQYVIEQQLQKLCGLFLLRTHRAADMRIFHFGVLPHADSPAVDHYSLHVQCAWRLENPVEIVTGRADLWEPIDPGPDFDWDTWDYDTSDTVQDRQLRHLLGEDQPQPVQPTDRIPPMRVTHVAASSYGDLTLQFANAHRLCLFPAGSRSEDWRLLRPGTSDPHIVITGGKLLGHHESKACEDRHA